MATMWLAIEPLVRSRMVTARAPFSTLSTSHAAARCRGATSDTIAQGACDSATIRPLTRRCSDVDVLPGLDTGPAAAASKVQLYGRLICDSNSPGRIVPVEPRGPG
jgi:hypothetical protein